MNQMPLDQLTKVIKDAFNGACRCLLLERVVCEWCTMLGFHLVSRFRSDVSLKYLYFGPKRTWLSWSTARSAT